MVEIKWMKLSEIKAQWLHRMYTPAENKPERDFLETDF